MPTRFELRQHRVDVGALSLNYLDYEELLDGKAATDTIVILHAQAD